MEEGLGSSMKLSVVIPCYCSEKTIRGVVEEAIDTIRKRGDAFEIILVNDCSPDRTWLAIRELCKAHASVQGVSLARTFGQHTAIIAGFRNVTGDVVCCMDDDGQTPPREMYKLVDPLVDPLEAHDIVIGKYGVKRHRAFRNLGSKIHDRMAVYLLNKPKDLHATSFFACKRFVIEDILKYTNPYPYMLGLLLRTTSDIVNVEIEHRERAAGKSGSTLKKLIGLWLNGFTAFSVKPLRMATLLGACIAGAGFLLGGYIVIKRLAYPDIAIAGWSSLIAANIFLGGMIMILLGMIGEYIGRIYISLNSSSQYVVKESVNTEKESP
jgi:undecaprenyl-phosphate 4-deoxy-4-formamido-L-arabinose transferase